MAYTQRSAAAPQTLTLPTVDEVDFCNPEEIEGYGHLLASAFRNCGGFSTLPSRNKTLTHIRIYAERWVIQVEELLHNPRQSQSDRILTWYDINHRIAFGRPADKKYFSPRLRLSPTASPDRFTLLAARLDSGAIPTIG